MSKLVVFIFAIMISYQLEAQEYNIKFLKGVKWKKALKMAEKANKPIFVDAYTTWCGPCKIMDRDVFTNKDVAKFFNDNFINLKMDMEKGEGIKLKTDWQIEAFPTLLYFDESGTIIHRVVGAYDVEEFLEYSKMALQDDKVAINLQRRYDNGERNGVFIYDYLVSLRLGYHKDLERSVALDYISSLTNKELLEKDNWKVLKHFMKDPNSKEFQYLVNNADKLKETNGNKEVDDMLYKIIADKIQTWTYWYGKKPFETEKEAALIDFLQSSEYKDAPGLLGKLLINKFKRLEDKSQYIETIDYVVKFNLTSDTADIVNYVNTIVNTYESDVAWAKALKWIQIAENKETKIEHKAAILTAKSNVLAKLGNKTEAELAQLAAQKADKEAEAAGTKIHTIPMMKMNGGGF
ncbi:thioredoxin family protein [Cellulophaga omnivescoria]|uniref:thioredoxin family protein n=1 Tax=Cellulophaga omnivescoria TaxID=1888890 RepID=UPI0015C57561|nr:thioredoxin family protein [Cellulophaga omnivescoria]